MQDVVINDAQVDLNVYVNPPPNSTRVDQHSDRDGQPMVSCPAATPRSNPCSLAEVTKPDNLVVKTDDQAGSSHDPTKGWDPDMALTEMAEMVGVDLNDWVGKCLDTYPSYTILMCCQALSNFSQ